MGRPPRPSTTKPKKWQSYFDRYKRDDNFVTTPPRKPVPTLMKRVESAVDFFSYEHEVHEGVIMAPAGMHIDVFGAIALFQELDEALKTVRTFSGARADLIIERAGGRWKVTEVGAAK